MRKIKISCFPYRNYIDVYVNNVSFATDKLLSILDAFLDQRVIILIDTNIDYARTLLFISKSIGIAEIITRPYVPRFIMVCNKTELLCLLTQANINNFEGLFISNIRNDIILDDFMYSLEYTASSMVKNRISDISISINFPENQMVISLLKGKYGIMCVKNKISSILG